MTMSELEWGTIQHLIKSKLPNLQNVLVQCRLEMEGTGDGEVTITDEVLTDLEHALDQSLEQLQAMRATLKSEV